MPRLCSGHLVTFSVLPRDNRMGSPRMQGTCDCKEKIALTFSPFVHVQPSQGRFPFITISPSPLKEANSNSEQAPYLCHHAGLPNGPPSSGRLQETLVCVCVCVCVSTHHLVCVLVCVGRLITERTHQSPVHCSLKSFVFLLIPWP